MNERKEKERLVSLKDKLKRDLDQSQSRISSLQEQVSFDKLRYEKIYKNILVSVPVDQASGKCYHSLSKVNQHS